MCLLCLEFSSKDSHLSLNVCIKVIILNTESVIFSTKSINYNTEFIDFKTNCYQYIRDVALKLRAFPPLCSSGRPIAVGFAGVDARLSHKASFLHRRILIFY